MNNLRDVAIDAHGGLGRWNELSTASVHLRTGGALWAIKGQDGVINDSTVHVDLHRQFTSHTPFGAADLHDEYMPDRVAVVDRLGQVIEERRKPREAFAGHGLDTPWDRLHLAYFSGYAMWTYLTQPFSWATPGVVTEDLGPWEEAGETWHRLRVRFPDSIATHASEAVYYIDARGRLRRQDYVAEVLGVPGPVAHYSMGHRDYDGIVVPTSRRVYLIGEDGRVVREPVIVTIDLDDVHFQPR